LELFATWITGLAGAALALLAAAAPAYAVETPSQVAAALSAGHPEVARLLRDNPGIFRGWQQEADIWPNVLLRAPLLPGGVWRVHDLRRPQPPVVTPSMAECAGLPPPADAMVLYDGHGTAALPTAAAAGFTETDGTLISDAKSYTHVASRAAFGDVQVHIEYRSRAPALGDWQYRGNSGLFLMGRYEVQILDAWQNPNYADGMMGALYGQVPPIANAALPPDRWQCLDVIFTAPRFEGDRLVIPARATVVHNGVVIQANAAFLGPTKFAKSMPYAPHDAALPVKLQNHGDGNSMMAFRNFWARPL
jgi:hypothetical protein